MWRKEDSKPQGVTPAAVPPGAAATLPSPAAQAATPTAAASPSSPPVSPRAAACVTQGIRIKGEVTGKEDIFLDGTLEGKLDMGNAVVTVGPNGKIKADISGREVIVRGQVEGKINGTERVQLWNSGRVVGEVRTERLAIEDGATLRGYVEAGKAQTRTADKSSKSAGSEAVEKQRSASASSQAAVI
jgi:cytoskeletal protein CcmA (bactofilin family)